MRLRHFGVLLLVVVAALPLAVAGVIMVRRAEVTALADVREANQRLARRVASRIGAFVDDQVALLRTLGASFAPAAGATPRQLHAILAAYPVLFHPLLAEVDVVSLDPGARELATSRAGDELRARVGDPAVEGAREHGVALGEVRLSEHFAPLLTAGVTLESGGEPFAVAVAQLDLVGLAPLLADARVGVTGYARLSTRDGTLIGHGDPEENRRVFSRARDPSFAHIAAGERRYRDSQGRDVVAAVADVPNLPWKVIIEQPTEEAFGDARRLRRDLGFIVVAALALALLLGLFVGREPVRAIEAMRRHAREVARGNLDATVTLPPLRELRSLADGLNEMARELKRLQDEMRSRERLSTFARVAAGLAHDLQTPIEDVRSACYEALAHPGDHGAREMLRSAVQHQLPRLHRYVGDLRRLAQEGHVGLQLSSVDPHALAEAVAADAAAASKWLGVKLVVEGHAARIWADRSLLSRALANLVANGADACVQRSPPSGTVTIRVSDTRTATGEDGLQIDVVDDGVGIPPALLAELLVNDFRSTKRNSGVGLGLGVARHVAAAHGGTVTAMSQAGIGSRFRLVLPRRAAAGVSADEAGSPQGESA